MWVHHSVLVQRCYRPFRADLSPKVCDVKPASESSHSVIIANFPPFHQTLGRFKDEW